MATANQEHALLTREDIQAACREGFWTLPAAVLSPYERLELIERVRDYLSAIEEGWLGQNELQALLDLHALLHSWLDD